MAVEIGTAFLVGKKGIGAPKSGYRTLGEFISALLPNIYVFSGLIIFIFFIIAGFGIMTSAGDAEKQAKAQKTMTATVIGFLIIFGSYWLIQIIEFITGVKIFQSGI